MEVLITRYHELALRRAAALGTCTVYEVASIKRQPIGCRILMSLYEGSPPGHPTFLVLSTTRGDIAPDVAAIHDLQLAFGGGNGAPGDQKTAEHCSQECGQQDC